jgi:predicted transcriptional regulator
MEVHVPLDVHARLDQLASDTGRSRDELVGDALAGYLGGLAQICTELDGRYDDLKAGRIRLVSGEEVRAHFRERSAGRH